MPDLPTCLADIPYHVPVSKPKMAAALRMDERTLQAHVDAGDLVYVIRGKRRYFLREDAETFLERQKRRETPPCPSINRKTRRSTTTTSNLVEIDFTAALRNELEV